MAREPSIMDGTLMKKRNELGKFFQEHYLTGIGAEVGCLRGEFSRFLSKHYKGKILCIDNFVGEVGVPYDPLVEEKCRENIKGTRCILIKDSSVNGSNRVPNESLDWVYIDAGHSYEEVRADLEAWFPKVRKGGVFSGHDYVHYVSGDFAFGVIEAVDEFCEKHGYKIKELLDAKKFASWYFIK